MMHPRLTVVTAVRDRAWCLERCIRSILDQGYEPLEYIIIDGGSTDGTVDVIRRYADRLAYWVSEPDQGIYDALNKGFARATGDILAWLGSDDQYLPGALRAVGETFRRWPDIHWLTTCFPGYADADGVWTKCIFQPGYSRELMRCVTPARAETYPCIQQESTFFRRSLWESAGSRLNDRRKFAADWEKWLEFWERTDLVGLMRPLALFGVHAGQAHAPAGAHDEVREILRPWIRPGHALYRCARRLRLLRSAARVVHWNAASRDWELRRVKL